MEDSFDAHNDKSLHNLLENSENLGNSELLVFLFIVFEKVSFLAVFHDDFKLLAFLVEVWVIDFDEVGMYKFFHDFDLFQSLISLEGVDMDAFEGKRTVFAIFDQVDTPETALTYGFYRFIVLHHRRVLLNYNITIHRRSKLS